MADDLDRRLLDEPIDVPEEPYRSAIMARWRIEPFEAAADSAAEIYELYLRYREAGDFPGMEMARRCLHLGFTEARSHARGVTPSLPLRPQAADIFYKTYRMVRNDPVFAEMRAVYRAARDSDERKDG